MKNEMKLEFDALSINEGFARVSVASFMTILNPTLEEVADVKTAVSEAVTNAIIHGYDNADQTEGTEKKVSISCRLEKDSIHIEVEDKGNGIPNVEQAMEPLYTTKPELERSGMGFAFMEAFMDDLQVVSKIGEGTKIHMVKKIGMGSWLDDED